MDLKLLQYLTQHPLNRRTRLRNLPGIAKWYFASRALQPCEVIAPFVNKSKLIVTPGRWGSEANMLCGLHEFVDMSFLLHLLRPADLFCDIGSNIGAFTLLASSAIGARSIAFEPIESSFQSLRKNAAVNNIEKIVDLRQIGLGRERGHLSFTATQDTMNHVAVDGDTMDRQTVKIDCLDDAIGDEVPTLVKIDVEGWEHEVIKGAGNTLNQPDLLALILELNGSGQRYGFSDDTTHGILLNAGFLPYQYLPFERRLIDAGGKHNRSGNTLYVRDLPAVTARLQSAPPYTVRQFSI